MPISQGSITSLSSVILGLDPGIHSFPVFHFGCRIECGMTLEGTGCHFTFSMTPFSQSSSSMTSPLSVILGQAERDPGIHHNITFPHYPLPTTQPPFAFSLFFILGLDQGETLKTKNAQDYQAFFVVYVLISTSRIPGKPCMFR